MECHNNKSQYYVDIMDKLIENKDRIMKVENKITHSLLTTDCYLTLLRRLITCPEIVEKKT